MNKKLFSKTLKYNNKKMNFEDFNKKVLLKYNFNNALIEYQNNNKKLIGVSKKKKKIFGFSYIIKKNTKNKINHITGKEFPLTNRELKTLKNFGFFKSKKNSKSMKGGAMGIFCRC